MSDNQTPVPGQERCGKLIGYDGNGFNEPQTPIYCALPKGHPRLCVGVGKPNERDLARGEELAKKHGW